MVDVRTENRMENRVENGLGGDGRSIAGLLRELRDETTILLRQEVALARTELSEKAARAGRNAAYLATGGLVAYAGVLFLLLAATAGLLVALEAMGLDRRVNVVAGAADRRRHRGARGVRPGAERDHDSQARIARPRNDQGVLWRRFRARRTM